MKKMLSKRLYADKSSRNRIQSLALTVMCKRRHRQLFITHRLTLWHRSFLWMQWRFFKGWITRLNTDLVRWQLTEIMAWLPSQLLNNICNIWLQHMLYIVYFTVFSNSICNPLLKLHKTAGVGFTFTQKLLVNLQIITKKRQVTHWTHSKWKD